MESARQDHVRRRFDPIEASDNLIGQLIVLAAADAMNEQLPQK